MSEETPELWRSEFHQLGAQGVGQEIRRGRWSDDKLSAAKHWLQMEDVRRWQLGTPEKRLASANFKKLARYLLTVLLVLFAAVRLFRLMRHGI